MQENHLNRKTEEAMPSYFQHIHSSESRPVASWQSVQSFITSDPVIRELTEQYRQRLAVSKSFADELKPLSPAITVSAQMDGYGRQLANFRRPTHHLMVEFDKVPREEMEQARLLIEQDPHTTVCHRSIGGGATTSSAATPPPTTTTSPPLSSSS